MHAEHQGANLVRGIKDIRIDHLIAQNHVRIFAGVRVNGSTKFSQIAYRFVPGPNPPIDHLHERGLLLQNNQMAAVSPTLQRHRTDRQYRSVVWLACDGFIAPDTAISCAILAFVLLFAMHCLTFLIFSIYCNAHNLSSD